MSEHAVSIEKISKSFGETQALKEVSFSVPPGEIFGIIGPDGAGKTTLFRILTTLLVQDSGTATLMGMDTVEGFRRIRNIVGYMPGRFSLYYDLSVEENLQFFATIFGVSWRENYDLVKDIYSQIEPFRRRPAGKLSGGMKQKLALSCALIHAPEVLIMDEPTTGVDAVSRREFWEMLRRLQQKNITILVSTPYMDEAEQCDRVALMQRGQVLGIDTPKGITENFGRDLFAVRTGDMFRLPEDLRSHPQNHSAYRFGDAVHFVPEKRDLTGKEISEYLEKKDHDSIHVKRISPGIEDCFMAFMEEDEQRS